MSLSTSRFAILLLLVVGLSLAGWAPPKRSLFSDLSVGRPIGVRDRGTTFELTVFSDAKMPNSHRVVEIGDDYLIVEDLAGVTRSTIPIYAIKAIVHLPLGNEP